MTDGDIEQERLREFYDRQAASNPKHAAVLGEPNEFALSYREAQELRVFRELLPLKPSYRFVEFGSGGGRWLHAAAPIVDQCIGIELSSRCVETSRARLQKFDNVTIHQSAVQDYQLSGQFDVFYYSGVLLYLDQSEIDQCFHKHMPNLKSDGWVLIRDSISLSETHRYPRKEGYKTIYRSVETWNQIFQSHGLQLVKRVPANEFPISARVRSSSTLRSIHWISQKFGFESWFLDAVGKNFGDISNAQVLDPGYSHDFMLCRRAA